jgi:DNA repair protein RadC
MDTHVTLQQRLLLYTAASMSTAELLAVLLDSPLEVAEAVLAYHSSLRQLAQASQADLHHLNEVEKARLLAAMELGKRLIAFSPDEQPIITTADDAARLVADMSTLPQEHVRAILLDLNRRVVAVPTLYIGTVNASVLRVAEVFREAILRNTPAMILVHNHPAGDPSPSPEDVELTRTLIAAGKLFDISLVDHLIISQRGWVSLKALQLAF